MSAQVPPPKQQKTDSFVALNRHAWRRLERSVPPADVDWTMAMMTSYVLAANWTGDPTQTNNGLARGQLIAEFEQKEGDRRGVSRDTVHRRRRKLCDAGHIAVKSNRHTTVITVVHYDDLTRTPDTRTTESRDSSQKNANSEPIGAQPIALAHNQIDDSRTTKAGDFSQGNRDSELSGAQPNLASAHTSSRSNAVQQERTFTSEPENGSDLSAFEDEDVGELIVCMKALGWNENAGTRADLVSCLEAMEDCFENDRVPRLMDKVAEVAQSREKTDKGARIEWLLQNPGEWKNDRWITDDDALLAYEEEGSE